MNRNFIKCILVAIIAVALAGQAVAIEKVSPDPRGLKVVNQLLDALAKEDPAERLAAVIPLVQASLLNNAGDDLEQGVKRYSYKKAWQNVKFYKRPASIYEVHRGRNVTVGYGKTAQRGRVDKYFVNKRAGIAGRPAPIAVFFPADGGEPRIYGMGSL